MNSPVTKNNKNFGEIFLDRVHYTPDDKKSVVVLGLGRGGSWTALKLAESGVPEFTIFDNDIVDESNLRFFDSVPYDYSDLGLPKTEALKNKMKKKFPHVKVTTYNIRISSAISIAALDQAFGDSLIVVWAIDSREGLMLADSPLILKRISVFLGLQAGGAGGGFCIVYIPFSLFPCPKHSLGLSSFDELQELKASESNITVQDIQVVTDSTVKVIESLLFPTFKPYFDAFDLERGNFLKIQRLYDGRYRKLWIYPPSVSDCIYCGNHH